MILLKPNLDSFTWADISDKEYFSSTYSDCISNSRLSLINPEQGGSPEKFLANEHFTSDSFLLGSAVHAEVLQPGEFDIIGNVDRPTAKLGLMADELFKCYPNVTTEDIIKASDKVNYYKGKMDEAKCQMVLDRCLPYWDKLKNLYDSKSITKDPIFLDNNSKAKYDFCIASVRSNPEITSLLSPEDFFDDVEVGNEVAFFINIDAIDTETGQCVELPFKAKLDNFTIVGNSLTLNDLKTTGHWISKFGESFNKYHYYRQMGAYGWLLRLYAKRRNVEVKSYKANMLLVSTVPDFRSGVFKVKDSDIQRGFDEFKHLMKLVAKVKMQ